MVCCSEAVQQGYKKAAGMSLIRPQYRLRSLQLQQSSVLSTLRSKTCHVRRCIRTQTSSSSTTRSITKCKQTHSRPQISNLQFWIHKPTWARSAVNTFRCLVGCTSGDFATMWWLQAAHPELGMATTMPLSMAAGIATSILLETTLLHLGQDRLPLKMAARAAVGMSMISMLAMETTENAVNYALTGGFVDMSSSYFWLAAISSAMAGFLVPLPYNYLRLRAFNQSCH